MIKVKTLTNTGLGKGEEETGNIRRNLQNLSSRTHPLYFNTQVEKQ